MYVRELCVWDYITVNQGNENRIDPTLLRLELIEDIMISTMYVCIQQELWVRDCITVKSGKRKQDRPYIAKIGSIWKEEKGEL